MVRRTHMPLSVHAHAEERASSPSERFDHRAETGSYHDAHDSRRRAGFRVGHDRPVRRRVRAQCGSRTPAPAGGADVLGDHRGRRLAAQRLPPLALTPSTAHVLTTHAHAGVRSDAEMSAFATGSSSPGGRSVATTGSTARRHSFESHQKCSHAGTRCQGRGYPWPSRSAPTRPAAANR